MVGSSGTPAREELSRSDPTHAMMDQICMDQDCEDCRHLWRAYAAATSDYFSVDAQLQAAAGKDNFEAVALLIPRLEASEETKAAVRNALRQHEEETGYR